MKAKGNGSPEQCVENLLLIVRGEVPFERLKGIDATLTDRPGEEAAPLLEADAEWLVETYEPRVSLGSVSMTAELAKAGHFVIGVDAIKQ